MITDAKIRKLKVPPKSQLHPDKLPLGEGLQLHTFASGRKTFIFAYRFENKQKTLTIGNYPYTSIKNNVACCSVLDKHKTAI